jgi:ribonuclease T2
MLYISTNNMMTSKFQLTTLAVIVSSALAVSDNLSKRDSETCTDPQTSCQGSSTNTCCFNTPGGLFQQVQFWDTDPATGPEDSWTIHGLWPNNCDGTYSENCDSSRAYKDITQLLTNAGETDTLDYMQTYWISNDESNEAFWEHEWATHGTCISTLDPACYTDYNTGDEAVDFFKTVVSLFQTLDTYTVSNAIFIYVFRCSYVHKIRRDSTANPRRQILSNAGIVPSDDTTYNLSDMNAALEASFGAPVVLLCESGAVYEIYYGFNVQGSLQSGEFIPTTSSEFLIYFQFLFMVYVTATKLALANDCLCHLAGSKTNCPSTVKYPTKSG